MQVNVLTVNGTPQVVPVAATPTVGLKLRALNRKGDPRIYYSHVNTVSGNPTSLAGFPIDPAKEDEFISADHFNGGGSVYVATEGGPATLLCVSQ
jgi:hypothetical protein